MHELDVGDRRHEAKKGISFRSSLMAVVVFYLAAALLNGRHMHESAARRPYGPARTAWMTLTSPVRQAAVRLRLDRFRALFEPFQNPENAP